MVVSQGLKSVTQTLGCVISLFIISPQVSQTLWNIFIVVTHLTIYSVPGNLEGQIFWQNMNYSIAYFMFQMTVLVGVIVPVMIGTGTVLGGILRGWSQEAQKQVSLI